MPKIHYVLSCGQFCVHPTPTCLRHAKEFVHREQRQENYAREDLRTSRRKTVLPFVVALPPKEIKKLKSSEIIGSIYTINQFNQCQSISIIQNDGHPWKTLKVRLRNVESLDHLHTTRIRKACSLPHTSLQARQEVTKVMPRKRYLHGWNGTTPAACACHISSSQDCQELLYKSI